MLVHYEDLCADLEGQMRRLAAHLGINVRNRMWPPLVQAASFEAMRTRADELAPGPVGVLKDRARFFRRGSSGAARDVLSSDELAHFRARAARLAPPDLLTWLHREDHPRP